MHISETYRARAAEMLARANEQHSPDQRAHWVLMAAQWADFARRVEAEDRVFQDHPPKA